MLVDTTCQNATFREVEDMRKIVILSFISLDGVMQAPGGPEEDTSGGFKYGGWTVPYFDETAGVIFANYKRAGQIKTGSFA